MTTNPTPWTSLITARETFGMSRYRLAKEMGINLSHLGRLEKGLATPRADTIRRASEALGVPVAEITPHDEGSQLVITVDQLQAIIREALKPVPTPAMPTVVNTSDAPLKLWGVRRNTDMTEGRGAMRLERAFLTEDQAHAWVETQHDYPGHPSFKVEPLTLDLTALDTFEGMEIPR